MNRSHQMPFGAQVDPQGRTRFRLWAPSARHVTLKTRSRGGAAREIALGARDEGWYEATLTDVAPGAQYKFGIDGELDVADPASRFNPGGVHEHSIVVDPRAFEWRDEGWRGHEWHELVIYELHVGTFTREGTYSALAARLDDLVELGINTLELLPLASFAGARGWGYDGVLPYAPHPAYGTPDELKQLVQAAHARKLSVLLDVVYNHFGPDGNYLSRYARDFFTSRHHTPWGDAIDFSNPTVRQFFIQNTLYWLNEFHFDGVRIDAVHAMYDDGPRHFIDELIDTVQDGPGRTRRVHIVLENHRNEARRLRRPRVSQWNDDFHHAMHVLLTGEKESYYEDFARRPIEQLGRSLTQGFAFQGERSTHSGEPRGEASGHLNPAAFVNFLQNHDQVGNRALGERLAQLCEPESLRAAFAVFLLAPQLPMLFMGEEYAARQPFYYFCDYSGELADAVRDGRREEFSGFAAFSDEKLREQIPDPNALQTFERSRLMWEERTQPAHKGWWEFVTQLLRLRAQRVVPLTRNIEPHRSTFSIEDHALNVSWPTSKGEVLQLIANLSEHTSRVSHVPDDRELIFATSSVHTEETVRTNVVAPWEVRVFVHRPS